MNKNDKKYIDFRIRCSLDEIDACSNRIESGQCSEENKKTLIGWIKKQKNVLIGFGYRGKIRRLKRSKSRTTIVAEKDECRE